MGCTVATSVFSSFPSVWHCCSHPASGPNSSWTGLCGSPAHTPGHPPLPLRRWLFPVDCRDAASRGPISGATSQERLLLREFHVTQFPGCPPISASTPPDQQDAGPSSMRREGRRDFITSEGAVVICTDGGRYMRAYVRTLIPRATAHVRTPGLGREERWA